LNIRSLKNKTVEVEQLLHEHDIDILCLTETFLTNKLASHIFPNHHLFRVDRNHKKGGGVAILASKLLKSKQVDFLTNDTIESIALRVQLDFNKSFNVTCIYRPPNYAKQCLSDNIDCMNDIFMNQRKDQTNIFTGDFNMRTEIVKQKLKSVLDKNELRQLVTEPTRENVILDLLITNQPDKIMDVRVLNTHLSDHKLVLAKYAFGNYKKQTKYIYVREYNKINYWNFGIDVLNIPEAAKSNCDEQLEYIIENIVQVFDKHAPKKRKKIKESKKKMILSDETKLLKKQRDQAYKLFKRGLTDKNTYKNICKQTKKGIKKDKKDTVQNIIKQTNVYEGIKQLVQIGKNNNNNILDENIIDVNNINKHFVNICKNENVTNKNNLNVKECRTKFTLCKVTSSQIRHVWKCFKDKNKTKEDDTGLCNRMVNLTILAPNITELITTFVNMSLADNHIPVCLKTARIMPIPKIKNPSATDFRPISILPVFLKILEKIVYAQLSKYMFMNNYINERQFGFKTGQSTTTYMLELMDYIYKLICDDKIGMMISLDLKKAFDKVDRKLLIEKLGWYGIESGWFEALLTNRKQYVEYNGKRSTEEYTDRGIPQGSALSGLLFVIFLNDMPECLCHTQPYFYADDTNLLDSDYTDNYQELKVRVEGDIQRVLK